MTEQEAIKWINDRMCYGRGKWSEHHQPVIDEYWQAGELAMQALNKQIPMKPKTRSSRKEGWTFYICPYCGYVYGEGVLGRYCENCGQAIDCSEYEKHETAKD